MQPCTIEGTWQQVALRQLGATAAEPFLASHSICTRAAARPAGQATPPECFIAVRRLRQAFSLSLHCSVLHFASCQRLTRQVRPTTLPARLRMAEMRCSVLLMPARLSAPNSPTCMKQRVNLVGSNQRRLSAMSKARAAPRKWRLVASQWRRCWPVPQPSASHCPAGSMSAQHHWLTASLPAPLHTAGRLPTQAPLPGAGRHQGTAPAGAGGVQAGGSRLMMRVHAAKGRP